MKGRLGKAGIIVDVNQEKVLQALDRMVRSDLAACAAKQNLSELLQCRELVVFRSCPMPVFTDFLKKLNGLYQAEKKHMGKIKRQDFRLAIIGKASDVCEIEQNWSGSYELTSIEGTYTYEKIMRAKGSALQPEFQKVLFFSRVLSDENYMNIYEIVEQMDYQSAFCYNFNSVLTEIKDMKKYMTGLRLWLAAGAWYYERNTQG